MVWGSEGDYMMVGRGNEGECMVVMVDLVVRLRECVMGMKGHVLVGEAKGRGGDEN